MSSTITLSFIIHLFLNGYFVLSKREEFSSHVWAVRLNHEDHETVADSVGLQSLGDVFSGVHEFRLTKANHANLKRQLGHDDAVLDYVHQSVVSHPAVVWAEFQKPLKRERRYSEQGRGDQSFNDPSFIQQWHLINNREEGHDINVTGVWALNITGHSVTIAIVDDGLEYKNPEILANYNSYGSYDFNNEDHDPRPDTSTVYNSHGTRCAGLVAAVANNTFCGVGVAYNSYVSGIRLLDGTITDLLEAKSLTYKTHVNHIYSCSWGPTDDGMTVEAPGTLAQLALKLGTERGRHGYGSVFVFASGNGGSKDDNCNFDGYANSIYTVTIGAVDELDRKPYYAEECAAKFAVTYSNGVRRGDRNIVTADLQRSKGCTSSFSGTSAAAPMAAGVIALALEVRPCLTWHDVQSLLVYTARPLDLQEVEWTTNGCGFRHSHQHGFGVLDAYRLTTTARVWPLLPKTFSWSSPTQNHNLEIPPTGEWVMSNYTITANSLPLGLVTLEHISVSVTLEHQFRGAVVIDLVSPFGTVSNLATARSRDTSNRGFNDWTFTTVRCWGENPLGVWSLKVTDNMSMGQKTGLSRGTLVQWRLILRGINITQEDIDERRLLVDTVVSNISSVKQIDCPPTQKNVKEITFPETTSSNKLLRILSAVGAVAVILVLVHIILTFMMRRCFNGKGNNYISSLPNVPHYHQSSSNVEEEVLLLSDLSRSRDDCWENEENEGEDKESISSDRQPLTDHLSSSEL